MKSPLLWLAAAILLGEATAQDCSCIDFQDTHGFGQCKKNDFFNFDGAAPCYLQLPSNCTDRVESQTHPGKWISAEACTIEAINKFPKVCKCMSFINTNGYGQCKKKDSTIFNGTVICYVELPSNCTDLVESGTHPGRWISAEACTPEAIKQYQKDDNPTEIREAPPSYFQLNSLGHLECNHKVDCPPETTDPFICEEEEKDGEVVHTCIAQVYRYSCHVEKYICTEVVCVKKCYSLGEDTSQELIEGEKNLEVIEGRQYKEGMQYIEGRQYSCVEECGRPEGTICTQNEKCPHVSGSVLTIEVSAVAVQSLSKSSSSRKRCPHGTCKRGKRCCQLAYYHRRRFYVCPNSCPSFKT